MLTVVVWCVSFVFEVQTMPTRRKVMTTIYMEPEQASRLQALSNETGIPMAVYIRRCVDRVLEENSHLLPAKVEAPEQKCKSPRRKLCGLPFASCTRVASKVEFIERRRLGGVL